MSMTKPTYSRKEAKKHQKFFNGLLTGFFNLLDRQPKPGREEIRAEFINAESRWKAYCIAHHLGTRASELFNAKVSYEWERKYVQEPNQTKN